MGPSWRLATASYNQYLYSILYSAFSFQFTYIPINTTYILLALETICYSNDINSFS